MPIRRDNLEPSAGLLLFVMLRKLNVALAVGLGLALLTAAILLAQPRRWTAYASFIPEARRSMGNLAALSGVAAQLGVALPGGDNSPPAAFYSAILSSREILGAIVEHEYVVGSDQRADSGTLVDFYHSSGNTAALRRQNAIERLSKNLKPGVNLRTGIVEFRIEARTPQLALQIAEQALEELTRFNITRRRTQAGAERAFTERRRDEVQGELRDAEDRLQTFLQRNRDYRNSPQLTFEFERLSREVLLRQQIYAGLSQAHEQARIEEVRDTPVFTVLDRPRLPARPDKRGLWWKVPLTMVFGICVTFLGVFAREAFFPTGHVPSDEDLQELWSATLRDAWKPWRLFQPRWPVQR